MSAKGYSISEEQYYSLYQAKHLTWLLAQLTQKPTNEDNEVLIPLDSLSVVLHQLYSQLEAVVPTK